MNGVLKVASLNDQIHASRNSFVLVRNRFNQVTYNQREEAIDYLIHEKRGLKAKTCSLQSRKSPALAGGC